MRTFRVILLFGLLLVAIGIGPLTTQAAPPAEITCEGDLLLHSSFMPVVPGCSYRVEGTGPGLPTGVLGPAIVGVQTDFNWTVEGPGTWTGLVMRTNCGSSWGPSAFAASLTASCAPVAVPGCDVSIPLTESSVVGQFTDNTVAYWMPGEATDIVIEAGKTAWVLGTDESGAYYEIVWSCELLWVPVESMGPNYDAVWNGTPLPTDVVE